MVARYASLANNFLYTKYETIKKYTMYYFITNTFEAQIKAIYQIERTFTLSV